MRHLVQRLLWAVQLVPPATLFVTQLAMLSMRHLVQRLLWAVQLVQLVPLSEALRAMLLALQLQLQLRLAVPWLQLPVLPVMLLLMVLQQPVALCLMPPLVSPTLRLCKLHPMQLAPLRMLWKARLESLRLA